MKRNVSLFVRSTMALVLAMAMLMPSCAFAAPANRTAIVETEEETGTSVALATTKFAGQSRAAATEKNTPTAAKSGFLKRIEDTLSELQKKQEAARKERAAEKAAQNESSVETANSVLTKIATAKDKTLKLAAEKITITDPDTGNKSYFKSESLMKDALENTKSSRYRAGYEYDHSTGTVYKVSDSSAPVADKSSASVKGVTDSRITDKRGYSATSTETESTTASGATGTTNKKRIPCDIEKETISGTINRGANTYNVQVEYVQKVYAKDTGVLDNETSYVKNIKAGVGNGGAVNADMDYTEQKKFATGTKEDVSANYKYDAGTNTTDVKVRVGIGTGAKGAQYNEYVYENKYSGDVMGFCSSPVSRSKENTEAIATTLKEYSKSTPSGTTVTKRVAKTTIEEVTIPVIKATETRRSDDTEIKKGISVAEVVFTPTDHKPHYIPTKIVKEDNKPGVLRPITRHYGISTKVLTPGGTISVDLFEDVAEYGKDQDYNFYVVGGALKNPQWKVNIVAQHGYVIEEVIINGRSAGTNAQHAIKMTDNDEVQVKFKPVKILTGAITERCFINVTAQVMTEGGTLRVGNFGKVVEYVNPNDENAQHHHMGIGWFAMGSAKMSIDIQIIPKDGYRIKDVTVNDVSHGDVSSVTVSGNDESFAVKAWFEPVKAIYVTEPVATIENDVGVPPRFITANVMTPSGRITVNHYKNENVASALYGEPIINGAFHPVSVTVTPDEGYAVKDVVVNGVSHGAATTLFMPQLNNIVNAWFERDHNYVTATYGANGIVSPSGNSKVYYGENKTFKITPNKDYRIAFLVVDGKVIAPSSSYTFENVQTAHSLHVEFVKTSDVTNNYIYAEAGEGGVLSQEGLISLSAGASQDIQIIPDEGYEIDKVIVDGVEHTGITHYLFSNVRENHAISATFKLTKDRETFTVTASAGQGGSITPNGMTNVKAGDSITLKITPEEGYSIHGVYVNGEARNRISEVTLSDIRADQNVSVVFRNDNQEGVDLCVTDITPAAVYGGSKVTSFVRVVNQGNTAVEDISVELNVGEQIQSCGGGRIPAGGHRDIMFAWDAPLSGGNIKAVATVKADKSITEIDYANNTLTEAISVTAPYTEARDDEAPGTFNPAANIVPTDAPEVECFWEQSGSAYHTKATIEVTPSAEGLKSGYGFGLDAVVTIKTNNPELSADDLSVIARLPEYGYLKTKTLEEDKDKATETVDKDGDRVITKHYRLPENTSSMLAARRWYIPVEWPDMFNYIVHIQVTGLYTTEGNVELSKNCSIEVNSNMYTDEIHGQG